MSWFVTVAYILFFLSVLIPVYTYAIYPLILLSFHKRKYESDDAFLPKVSILVVSKRNENLTTEKLESLRNLKYPNCEILTCENVQSEGITAINSMQTGRIGALNCLVHAASGEILIYTDNKTPIDPSAIMYLVRHFADKRVGCVVGQLRNDNPSAFWKYENFVRRQEGKAGRVSGANKAIFAVRKELVEAVPENIINVDFYISTLVQQKGYDVLFEPRATAYEQPGEQADHVRDGAGYYQAFKKFWRMLLPRKGSFVYWSHRVLKWMTPFCMITALITSGICSFVHLPALFVLVCQLIGYGVVCFCYWKRRTSSDKSSIGKLVGVVVYFVELNVSYLIGLFRVAKKDYS